MMHDSKTMFWKKHCKLHLLLFTEIISCYLLKDTAFFLSFVHRPEKRGDAIFKIGLTIKCGFFTCILGVEVHSHKEAIVPHLCFKTLESF